VTRKEQEMNSMMRSAERPQEKKMISYACYREQQDKQMINKREVRKRLIK
jgi:hypothetical protein